MKYEQLEVWQRSFSLSVQIYRLFSESRDFGFKDQICRSGLSVPSNIAEGMERESDREKARFLSIAKGSIGELKTQIMIGEEIQYISSDESSILASECEQISKMLGSFIKTLRKNIEN
ncbi:four helix bundle protein [Shewanella eurypsychrophilus]|uniref:Four helix bundle protein n=1 Tax=Shewanella eurypsychrophilus TaxID=2593656 RepID=A0ABX6V8H0_9GAMM|nr:MULTISPECIES: four helix bundle protein [Shewanella]QFU23424.1 four helix bundle protein [Shewanella sp. YLB-09]QPG58652.1 four helix bundle protein [Shewanella eurypsychrophilus]